MAGKDQERAARLAGKLRENLRRRKAQARAQEGGAQDDGMHGPGEEPDRSGAPALPKSPPSG